MMAAWTAANPDAEKKPETPSTKVIRAMVAEMSPDALQAIKEILADKRHPKRFEAANAIMQQHIGKPMQAVELGNGDGGPLRIIVTQDDSGLL
jgi:hypothetical protein